ncbi:MAG: S9 family peptidase [Clostridia bacterium]|nr:S9 family peptidase [Clostridia bacterium]
MPSFEQYYAIRRVSRVGFGADGRDLFYVIDTSGQFNLWRHPLRGGCPEQLTSFDRGTVRAFQLSRDGRRLALLADQDGDERYQLYLMEPEGGWPRRITTRDDVQYLLAGGAFSPDGRRLAFAGTESRPTDMEPLILDVESGEVRSAGGAPGRNRYPAGWSPDGSSLLVLDQEGNTQANLYLLRLDEPGAEPELLTPHEGEAVYAPGPWLEDGSGFFLISDQGRDFAGLAFYRLAERRLEWLATPSWDVQEVTLSADERYLAYTVNEDGVSRLHVLDRATGREPELPSLPDGVLYSLEASPRPGSGELCLLLARASRPADVYVLDFLEGELRRLTRNQLGGLSASDLVEPEKVRFTSFDGRSVPAWLYRPRAAGEGRRVPAILSIHGGPESQELPMYMYGGLYQVLLDRGIAVLAPNIRGSTGYGRSYQKLIHHDWGGGELRDLEAAVRWLREQPWVDPGRIGVFGGSFGGFATLSCVTRLPEYWACGVSLMGPSNLVTFARAVPPSWRKWMAAWMGDPESERDFLLERSPITYVDQVRCPMLIVQGARDFRVVQAESEQMVEALRARGLEVEYLLFEDEGHGFMKRSNQERAWRSVVDFLTRHLLG